MGAITGLKEIIFSFVIKFYKCWEKGLLGKFINAWTIKEVSKSP